MSDEVTNKERAGRGHYLLTQYVGSQTTEWFAEDMLGSNAEPAPPEDEHLEGPEGEWLVDMLTDVLHYAVLRSMDCFTLLDRAMGHVKTELDEEKES